MYFSQLILDPRKAVIDGFYDAHQALWGLFSDSPERKRDFLYREMDPVTFLTVSARPPEDATGAWRVRSKPYAPRLSKGDRLYVSLRVNAVVKRKGADGRQDRFDVVQDARMRLLAAKEPVPPRAELAQSEGLKWLEKHQESWGLVFDPKGVNVTSYVQHRLWRYGSKAKVSALDMAGFARVTAPEAVLRALTLGVGPAKGFGCGLMLARRA
ncbi:CRISPR system Cascade subunit CasE [Fundidesulfovibrio magnetotacticus]|uniref:CRISPR system Cascade subunit CasE n=1 Tax=Fundidesulfovibrio magnetotacticus TaxID=2730080 RepID=A0A6V8LQP3_9BACT|nr:type I-E CRISPR-associated protein Cas6/Cse3/CasE [Fundidesulfovibrio magnetotacticus]GFK93300.1 CRISPR system Cascade subunit CasE [Fundidesulfovibrio magnetotacticus]